MVALQANPTLTSLDSLCDHSPAMVPTMEAVKVTHMSESIPQVSTPNLEVILATVSASESRHRASRASSALFNANIVPVLESLAGRAISSNDRKSCGFEIVQMGAISLQTR